MEHNEKKEQHFANICIDCKNAVPDDQGHGCPWSRKFEPVPGWTAEPAILRGCGRLQPVETYRITACPLFDPDGDLRDYLSNRRLPVRCVETGVEFRSMRAAAQAVGGNSAAICASTRSGRGYAYGYNWERIKKEGEV